MVLAILLALAATLPGDIPAQPGLYYRAGSSIVRIEGRATSFARTGSRLVSAATAGIKSAKINAQILGNTSEHVVPPVITFYYRLASANEAAGGSAGDLVLVKMTVKGNRRQFEMGAAGMGRASAGISLRSQVDCYKKQLDQQLYEVTPVTLEPGEYAFYLFRGYDLPGFIYDFTVPKVRGKSE
jgi:hypothetical protein